MRLLILLPPSLRHFELEVLRSLFSCDALEIVGACIDSRPPATAWRRIKLEWSKGRGGYILVMIAGKLWSRFSMEEMADTRPFVAARGIPTHLSPALTTDDTLRFIREAHPDAIYSAAYGIIREPVLSIAPRGVLSYHHGNIRRFRGQPAAFWELYHGEKEMGVTVQILNEVLDGGKIAHEITVPINPTDTWSSLYRRAYDASHDMIRDACLTLQTPHFSAVEVPRDQLGPLFTTPNLRQWLTLQVRVLWRRLKWRFGPRRTMTSHVP